MTTWYIGSSWSLKASYSQRNFNLGIHFLDLKEWVIGAQRYWGYYEKSFAFPLEGFDLKQMVKRWKTLYKNEKFFPIEVLKFWLGYKENVKNRTPLEGPKKGH